MLLPVWSGCRLVGGEATVPLPFEAHYFDTDGVYAESITMVTAVRSKSELLEYYTRYKDVFNFDNEDSTHKGVETSFRKAMDTYDDQFFKRSFLVVILLQEGSGSTWHEVEGVQSDGIVTVKRFTPELFTCDLSTCHFMIELRKEEDRGQTFSLKIADQRPD